MLRYEPQKGAPLFALSSPLMLEHDADSARVVASHPVPGASPTVAGAAATGAGALPVRNLHQPTK